MNRMIASRIAGVEFLAANTDLQALKSSHAPARVQLGAKLTKGLGCGADPDIGRQAALEDTDHILEAIEGADMVFITAGLGGGTGTGAAPIVASLASELGALTVAVVTKPFTFEGRRRQMQAEEGMRELQGAGGHADLDSQRSPAPDGRAIDAALRRLQRRRRRPAPGGPGHLRSHHRARPHQPGLRRRAGPSCAAWAMR